MKVFGALVVLALVGFVTFVVGAVIGSLSGGSTREVISAAKCFACSALVPNDASTTLFLWPKSSEGDEWRAELRRGGSFRSTSETVSLGPHDPLHKLPTYRDSKVRDIVFILPKAGGKGALEYGARVQEFLTQGRKVPGLHFQYRDVDWDKADSFRDLAGLITENSPHILGAIESLFDRMDADYRVDYIVAPVHGKPDRWILAGDRLGAQRTNRDPYYALKYYRRIDELSTSDLLQLYREQGSSEDSIVDGCHILLIVATDSLKDGMFSPHPLMEALTQLALSGSSVTVRLTDIPSRRLGDIELFAEVMDELLTDAGETPAGAMEPEPK